MEAISEENKDKIVKNLSLFFSIIALILSLISVVGVNKIQNRILNSDIETSITNKKNEDLKTDATQEVEILHSDGSTEKVQAKNSEDKISTIIEEKVEKPKNKSKKDFLKKNKNNKLQKFNVVERKRKEEKNKETKQQSALSNSAKNQEREINNNFYIQIGIFKNNESAKRNCDKIKKSLVGKICSTKKDKENRVASIIQGFNTKEEATKFAKKLAERENISFLIKKSL